MEDRTITGSRWSSTTSDVLAKVALKSASFRLLAGRALTVQDAGDSRTGCLYNVLSVSNAPRQQTNSAEEGGKEKH